MAEEYDDTVTKLGQEEEVEFDKWAGQMRLEGKIHPLDDFSDYDMRGYWKETGGNGQDTMETHFPDKWKRPNHPTFSVESVYAQGKFKEKYGSLAGYWDDDKFVHPVPEEELYNKYESDEQEEFTTIQQKESLEKKFGVKIDYAEKGLDTDTESIANKKEMAPNFVETMADISYGFLSGIYEGLRAVQELGAAGGAQIAKWQTGKDIDFDPDKDMRGIGINQGEAPSPVTGAGRFAQVAGQVSVGIAGAKALGVTKLAALAKNAYGSKAIALVSNAMVGLTIDTMSFSANEANFADVLKQLGLPTIEKIAKNPNDTYWQKKIKNGVDGVVGGLIVDSIIKTAKMFWKAGKQYVANRKVVEPILEYPAPTVYEPNVYDAEFIPIEGKMLQKQEPLSFRIGPPKTIEKGVK